MVSLLSKRDGGDRGLFTLQSPLHFLFHSQAEEAAGLYAACLYGGEGERQIERNHVCLSRIMACLCPSTGLKEGGDGGEERVEKEEKPLAYLFLSLHVFIFSALLNEYFDILGNTLVCCFI